MDKFVVEADCIPGGINGEAPDRKQILDSREIHGVLEFGQQIKNEGKEAFEHENWEGALTRYCQGDEMLKNFRAEPHLKEENETLSNMHRACLNNKANAALQMDKWQTALKASEHALKIKPDDEKALFRKAQALEGLGRTDEALETLEEIEAICEDVDNAEIRTSIMEDISERREVIADVNRRAAQDFNKMLKGMGDKGVFAGGRFLADGTSPPPALTGEEERKLKKMMDREDWLAGKAKHDASKMMRDGYPVTTPTLPTPSKGSGSGLPQRQPAITITQTQAKELLDELLAAYSSFTFQKAVHADAKAAAYEMHSFLLRLRRTAFVVQKPILTKWGFDPTEEGLEEMMLSLQVCTARNADLKKLADDTTRMLYGGEDGMLDF